MKHRACEICVKLKVPRRILVLRQLPGDAYQRHSMYDKAVKRQRKLEDGGVRQQQNREVAEREARRTAQTHSTS